MLRRLGIAGVVALIPLPSVCSGVTLTWNGGARDIAPASTAICTLLVQPSRPGATLPARWRLLYSGTSTVQPESALVFLDGPAPPGAAPPCAVSGPTTALEQLIHQTTVEFCGPGDGESTALAAYIVRIDATFHGRIAAVPASTMMSFGSGAIDPDAEVTIRGGSPVPYPPAVLSATAIPDSAGIPRIGVVGPAMRSVHTVILETPSDPSDTTTGPEAGADTLQLLSRTETALTAEVQASQAGGATVVLRTGADGPVGAAALNTSAYSTTSASYTMTPPWPYRAKDFAFIHAGGYFHLFYIRHDQTKLADDTEKDFGHAISTDLQTWTQLDSVLPVRPGKWDDLHVWAPSIVQSGGTYYMFYTGVTDIGYPYNWFQRIGVATSTDLMNWTRYDEPVYFGDIAPWSFADSSQQDGCQFRDSFVMTDPSDPSKWLMYHVAVPASARGQQIVGAAGVAQESVGRWGDLGPLWNTDAAHYLGYIESPMVFSHDALWYLMFSTNSSINIRFQTAASPTADSSGWVGTYRLYDEAGAGDPSNAWFAPEELSVPRHDYLAVVRDAGDAEDGILVQELTWGTPPHFALGVPSVVGIGEPELDGQVALWCEGGVLRSGRGTFTAIVPARVRGRLEIYDVAGRRVARLMDGQLSKGRNRVVWRGTDGEGRRVAAGVYFASLRTRLGSRVRRFVVLD